VHSSVLGGLVSIIVLVEGAGMSSCIVYINDLWWFNRVLIKGLVSSIVLIEEAHIS